MKAHDSFYDSVKWKKLRDRVLRRDSYTDQVEKRYSMTPSEAKLVHHVFPKEIFPEWQYSEWNLISVSVRTHQKLHDRENDALTAEGWALAERVGRKNNIDLLEAKRRISSKQSVSSSHEST